jgi:hypothetical protein
MTVDIEEFEDQGEYIDLHVTESSYTDETKPAISSLGSLVKSPKAVSQSSLQSQKSVEKSEVSKQGSQSGVVENVENVEHVENDKPASETCLQGQKSQSMPDKSESNAETPDCQPEDREPDESVPQ